MTQPTPPRVAYMTGKYPAVSLTFIQREIAALRAHGVEVRTCSVRRTPPSEHRGPPEIEAAATTFYILDTAKNPLALLAAQSAAFTAPARYFGALVLAWRLRGPGMIAALYQLIYFLEATILARYLQRDGITHVHNHFVGASATVTMLGTMIADIPYSLMLHGPTDLTFPSNWALGEKIARARFTACISHFARSQAMLVSDPEHWDRLRIIHCGVEPGLYDRPRIDSGTGLHLVFVGRLAPVKGLRALITAMGALQDQDIRLTIVGAGPDADALKAAAAPLGDKVHFTGALNQEEVAQTLAGADVFVLPSFAEGVPVVLMEALVAGLPVIATRVAGVQELVEDGVSGFVVPPGDVEALTQAIKAYAAMPDQGRAMAARGRETVLAEFDISAEAARLARLIEDGPGEVIRPEAATPKLTEGTL